MSERPTPGDVVAREIAETRGVPAPSVEASERLRGAALAVARDFEESMRTVTATAFNVGQSVAEFAEQIGVKWQAVRDVVASQRHRRDT